MVVKLPYSLHTRYRSIAIAWTVILIPPTFINLGLFYGLWFGTNLDRMLVLALPTGILGIFTIIATLERIYKLTLASPTYRPLRSPRYALDIFQWGYLGALLLISALISSSLSRGRGGEADNDHHHELQIRLVSLPASVLMFYLALLTALSLILNRLETGLPFRMGSLDAGEVVRPAVYYVVEDVVAVDGGGGTGFREAWGQRYGESEVFRDLIWTLSWVWMVAFFALAALFAALCFALPWQAVYAVGWAGPFPLAAWMAAWTVVYVRERLAEERGKGREEEEDGDDERLLGPGEDERTPLVGNGY